MKTLQDALSYIVSCRNENTKLVSEFKMLNNKITVSCERNSMFGDLMS